MQTVNTFWRDAARSGIIIGVIVIAVLFLKGWFSPAGSVGVMILSIIELVAIIYCLYKFGRQRAALYDPAQGYSYGQNMGFVMALMLLAGFIYGLGYYFIVNFIAPGMADMMAEASVATAYKMYGNMADQMVGMIGKMLRNPFFWAFYGMLAMTVYGGIVGLFVSPFVTRKPEPQNTQQDEQQA